MARARKSHAPDEEEAKTSRSKPLSAYSPRVDGHKYVIYVSLQRENDPTPRFIVHKFLGTFAARWYVSKIIGNDSIEWLTWFERDAMMVTGSGIHIRAHADQMKEIWNYAPTEDEASWEDEALGRTIARFKFGRHEDFNPDKLRSRNDDDPDAGGEDADNLLREGSDDKPVKRDKRDRPAKEPRVIKPKADLTGYVSANDIAKQLKVEGREVRGVLRAMKLQKPAHGNWAWPKDEAMKMKTLIEKGLKEGKKKK